MHGLAPASLSISPYDSDWPEAYTEEARRLIEPLSLYLVAVHHIGSTAVPGMYAKPIVDIGLEMERPSCIEPMAEYLRVLGYQDHGLHTGPDHWFWTREKEGLTLFHLHLWPQRSKSLARHLAFRNALRQDRALRERYSAEKIRWSVACEGDREQYQKLKQPFIAEVLKGHRVA